MMLASVAVMAGFTLLVWSAGKFIDGAAATAHYAGLSPLLIGMLVVGFGTSAPEIVVSIMAAADGTPTLALGNALGSNIVNFGLVMGVTALIAPILVHSNIVRRELPILLFVSLLVGLLLFDGSLARIEATLLLCGLVILLGWTGYVAWTTKKDPLASAVEQELNAVTMSLNVGLYWLVSGLVVLIISSRVLVWGAVQIATALAVDNLLIGLTVVALGTSLPELATSVLAALKGEHDIAIGNVVGSNLFNLLAVAGIAGVIAPIPVLPPDALQRDWVVMMLLTMAVFVMAMGFGRRGRINRWEGGILLCAYCGYTLVLINSLNAG